MKTHIHIILVALALPLAAFAAEGVVRVPGKAGGAAKSPDGAAEQREFKGPITVVNREDNTITINDLDMGTHKLQISDTTKLTRGDKPATWDDLKVGAKVTGTSRGSAAKAHADIVNIKG